jgi:hypothetical protein
MEKAKKSVVVAEKRLGKDAKNFTHKILDEKETVETAKKAFDKTV